jgi:ligand-binding SRPBCC domain-containing protein
MGLLMAKVYTLDCSIWLPGPPAEAFSFFSDAHNLESITPGWLHFEVITPRPIAMKTGALIDYRLRLHGIPLKWRTEITAWEPPVRFVDEQLRGPYYLWRHTHTFEAVDGGTLVRDHVDYSPRGGALIHRWFVRPDLLKIFAVRQKTIAELMGRGSAKIEFAG